jgi:hypothetical protein
MHLGKLLINLGRCQAQLFGLGFTLSPITYGYDNILNTTLF